MFNLAKKVNDFVKQLEYIEYANGNLHEKNSLDLRHGYLDYSLVSNQFSTLFKKIDKSKIISYKYSQDKELLKKISEKEHVPMKNIIITDGADAGLHHIAETFLSLRKKALIPIPSFPRSEFHIKIVGAQPVFVNIFGFTEEEKLNLIKLKSIKSKSDLIFLESPGNPTGEILTEKNLVNFLRNLDNTIIIIDQSLSGYNNDSLTNLAIQYPNVIIIKSFSKILGLSGLRIGYIIGSLDLLEYIRKTISPYEVSSFSLEAAKLFIAEPTLIQYRKKEVKQSIDYIKKKVLLNQSHSKSSFILLDGADKIPDFHRKLRKKNILTVDGKNFRGLEKTNTVRISLADFNKTKQLVDTIFNFLIH